jgi:hypothetical protein
MHYSCTYFFTLYDTYWDNNAFCTDLITCVKYIVVLERNKWQCGMFANLWIKLSSVVTSRIQSQTQSILNKRNKNLVEQIFPTSQSSLIVRYSNQNSSIKIFFLTQCTDQHFLVFVLSHVHPPATCVSHRFILKLIKLIHPSFSLTIQIACDAGLDCCNYKNWIKIEMMYKNYYYIVCCHVCIEFIDNNNWHSPQAQIWMKK